MQVILIICGGDLISFRRCTKHLYLITKTRIERLKSMKFLLGIGKKCHTNGLDVGLLDIIIGKEEREFMLEVIIDG